MFISEPSNPWALFVYGWLKIACFGRVVDMFATLSTLLLPGGRGLSDSCVGDHQIEGKQPHSEPCLLDFGKSVAYGAGMIVLFAVSDTAFDMISFF